MQEGVYVTTLRTMPCPFLRISIAFVHHLNNQVAVQTHRWSAIDELGQIHSLSHASEPPVMSPSVSNSVSGCIVQQNQQAA
jgi:hypothetical protein